MNFKANLRVPGIGVVYAENNRGLYLIAPENGFAEPDIIDMLADLYNRKQGNHLDVSDLAAFIEHEFNLARGGVVILSRVEEQETITVSEIP